MKKYIYSVLSLSLVLGLSACDRNSGGTTTLSVKFPEVAPTTSGKTVGALGNVNGVEDTWSSIAPTGFSGTNPFNCFGVYVTGPEPDLRQNSCYRSDGTLVKLIGLWKGGVPAGASVNLEVTSGKARAVGIFGFNAADGACQDFTGNKEMTKSLLSRPYFIGEVTKDFDGGTVNVDVPLAYDTNTWFEDCKGPAFNSGNNGSPSNGNGPLNPLANYGSGADGDLTLSAFNDVRTMNLPSGFPLITTSRVVSIDQPNAADKLKLDVHLKISNLVSKFKAGDEVALYVAAADGITACGLNVWPGFRARANVSAASNTANTLSVFLDDERFSSVTSAQLQAFSYGVSRNFCRMVATRIPNLNSLTFNEGATLGFTATNFGDMGQDSLDNDAGIIFLRVKNSIVMAGNGSIDLSARGFKGGAMDASVPAVRTGQGSRGADTQNTGGVNNGTGGSPYSPSTNAPGGGGHGGVGGKGFGTSVGGGTDGDTYGCGEANPNPSQSCLFGKLFMGGGGGAGYDSDGGAGGGLLMLTARNLSLGSFTLKLTADGESPINGSTMGGGGGAGGTVLANFEQITAAGNGSLHLLSNGGISKAIGAKGGSGGGGRNHLNIVNSCGVKSGRIRMTSFGGPQTNVSGGEAGDNGTNMVSGAGIVGCSTSIDMNSTPYLAKVSVAAVVYGGTFTMYGRNLGALSSAALVSVNSPYTSYPCTLTNPDPSHIDCTVGSNAGAFDVVVTNAAGNKFVLPNGMLVNPP